MGSFEIILSEGGKTNSLGRASEVIESIYADPSRLDELFDCISADDAWVRMRAVDSFEKIIRTKPEWVHPYLDRIFSNLIQSNQPSIQWHLAQIFSEVELTSEQQKKAVAWLKDKIKTTDIDWIVSVDVMKSLLHFHQNGFIEAEDLERLFRIQEEHKSKSVRKKAASLRGEII